MPALSVVARSTPHEGEATGALPGVFGGHKLTPVSSEKTAGVIVAYLYVYVIEQAIMFGRQRDINGFA